MKKRKVLFIDTVHPVLSEELEKDGFLCDHFYDCGMEVTVYGFLAPERSKQKDWKKNYKEAEVFSTFQGPYPQAVFDLKG